MVNHFVRQGKQGQVLTTCGGIDVQPYIASIRIIYTVLRIATVQVDIVAHGGRDFPCHKVSCHLLLRQILLRNTILKDDTATLVDRFTPGCQDLLSLLLCLIDGSLFCSYLSISLTQACGVCCHSLLFGQLGGEVVLGQFCKVANSAHVVCVLQT